MKKAQTPPSVFADLEMLLQVQKKAHQLQFAPTRKWSNTGFGETKSPFKTKGLDFQEVRPYQPGDDIRQIDWRITARYNKPFTKLYTDEKERQIFLVCDMRTRMKFASKGAFKSVLCATGAAFLAFVAQNKNDKIGFTVLKSDSLKTSQLLKGREPVIALLNELSEAGDPTQTTQDETTLTDALLQTEKAVRRGALIFILSDFSDFTEETQIVLQRLSDRNTCSLIHIYDILETHIPTGYFPITDGKNIAVLNSNGKTFQTLFQDDFVHLKNKLLQTVQTYQLGYLPVTTQDNLLPMLASYCQGGFS